MTVFSLIERPHNAALSDWQPPPRDEKVLINILHICEMWMIRDGVTFAIHELENLSLRPSRMLQLAHRFSIANWVSPALESLIKSPAAELTAEDADHLGPKVLLIIVKAREALEHERKLIAAYPPKLPSTCDDPCWCSSRLSCEKVWAEVWWKKVARALLHPCEPCPLSGVVILLQRTSHPGMCGECKNDLLNYMRSDAGRRAFQAEEKILDGATEAVLKYYGL
jgi:hypothetical protein